jgi:hypothetical protein
MFGSDARRVLADQHADVFAVGCIEAVASISAYLSRMLSGGGDVVMG